MKIFEDINISLSYSPYLFLLGVILIIAYVLFVYKITLPKISNIGKALLIVLRSLTLLSILLLLFDPVIKITTHKSIKPENLIFIDNSKSVEAFSTSEQKENLLRKIKEIRSNLNGINRFYTFGKSTKEIKSKKLDSLKLNGEATNFQSVLGEIKSRDNVAEAIIISDGIINEGMNPLYNTDNFNVPIYTISIGDSSSSMDVFVDQILSNKFIYAGRETDIEVAIGNKGLEDKEVTIGLYENNKLLDKKIITLSPSGINRVSFSYSNDQEGEHKLTAKINGAIEENNQKNNIKSTLINILSTKKKIAIIAGAPSPDLSAIINSLTKNEDFEINSLIQINDNNYYNDNNDFGIIEDAEILFLIGFPTKNSDQNLIRKIKNEIENNKSAFLLFSSTIDFTKLNQLEDLFSFKIKNKINKFLPSQVIPSNNIVGIIGKSDGNTENWKRLPPIDISMSNISTSINSKILLNQSSGRKAPILFINNSLGRKNMVLTASNIWRWKLRNSDNDSRLFDNFLLNSIKWLSINSGGEFFNANTDKKSYKLGESIIVNANLLDETYEPINNAEITISIDGDKNSKKFLSQGNGLYKTELKVTEPGLYKYSVKVTNPNSNFKEINGQINVEGVELELVKSKMDKILLKTIANNTGGEYYELNNANKLVYKLNKAYDAKIMTKLIDNELRLSNLEIILLLIVLFLSIEWILRKVYRML